MRSIQNTCNKLSRYRPIKLYCRRYLKQCAVTLILRESPWLSGIEVLMIKRAQRKGDPWSGQMGFPGGKRDADDTSNWEAAKRELFEEIGVDAEQSTRQVVCLSDMKSISNVAHRSMAITPYILQATEDFELCPNEEVADTIWVPLSFIENEYNRQTMNWTRRGVRVELPCYYFQGQHIWGMSLVMLDEMLHALSSPARKPFRYRGRKLRGAGRLIRQR